MVQLNIRPRHFTSNRDIGLFYSFKSNQPRLVGILVQKFYIVVIYIGIESMRMNISGGRNPNINEPNQALQRTNVLVTDCAPSSTLRAKHVRR